MQKTITECDMCGRIKSETNHWFTVFLSARANPVLPQGFTCLAGVLTEVNMRHACGQGCAVKFFQRFLANGTLDLDLPKEENIPEV